MRYRGRRGLPMAQVRHPDFQFVHRTNLPKPRYDFDLKTGHSETGMKACTYATNIRTEDGAEHIWVETPEGGSGWRLVEFRPVSEGAHISTYLAENLGRPLEQSLPTRHHLPLTSPISPFPSPPRRSQNPWFRWRTHRRPWSNGLLSSSIPRIPC